MRYKGPQSEYSYAGHCWSNRLLIVSVAGITLLTLFPFRMDGLAHTHSVPFLLSRSLKGVPPLDFSLNVLLFLPFGFGLSPFLQRRGIKGKKALFTTLIAGFVTSYAAEFLQFYIPTRDSGWNDTISNTTGVVAGYLLFAVLGPAILRLLSNWEVRLESLVSVRRACTILAAYFALFLAFSALLQTKTQLSNWNLESVLVVGADASGHHPWTGRILRLQIWDRALPGRTAEELTAGRDPKGGETGLLASFSISGTAPYQDGSDHLPALA